MFVRSFFLIGMEHKNKSDDEFQRRLVVATSQQKCVVALEGLIYRDRKNTKKFVISAYGVENAELVFGIEDDFVNQFAGALLHYGYLSTKMKNEIPIVKTQLIFDIFNSPTVKKIWSHLSSKPLSSEVTALVTAIHQFITTNSSSSLKDLTNEFYQNQLQQYPFTDDNAYIELIKEIIITMKKIGGSEYQITSYWPDIEKYIQDPGNNTYQKFIVDQINGEWRDKFIGENMREIIDEGIQLGLPVYFLIGKGHIQSLSGKLPSNYKGYVQRVYYKTSIIPDELLPKI